jgi:hypothetical protein
MKRSGITLVEVLIAIFVMGVGMLAILVLFPVGALSMARAIRDDRAFQSCTSATALANIWSLRQDANVQAALTANPPAPFLPPIPDGPGYPVYVDPIYFGLGQGRLGYVNGVTPGLQRCSVGFGGNNRGTRWFTLLDDIEFDSNGLPANGVNRPGTFSWAYVARRLCSADPKLVDLTVVVYSGRSTQVADGETSYQVSGSNAGDTSLTLGWSGTKPNIRTGGWILDTSYTTITDPSGRQYGTVAGWFYRVVGVRDINSSAIALQLQQPLRSPITTLVILENVIEVFEKGTGPNPGLIPQPGVAGGF